MNFSKAYFIALALAGTHLAHSQEGLPVYSDYFADNLYLYHPSMAGAGISGQIRLTARQQWFDQNNAPNLQTLAVNARVGERSGLGVIAFNDGNGFHSQTGGYLTYAHHLMFSRDEAALNQLSFGINAGMVQSRFDETEFDPTILDPIIAGIVQSTSYFNMDVGASYNLMEFSMHFTVKNLIFQNSKAEGDGFINSNRRRYVASAAYTFGQRFRSDWAYEPSVLVQILESSGESAFDGNFKVYRNMDFGKIFGGISYRTSLEGAEFLDSRDVSQERPNYLSPMLGVYFGDFLFAYTYTYQLNNVRFDSGGFHQITLGYNFLKGDGRRYDCNCPAINF